MNTPPHLPSDNYIASLLGISPDEYRWFKTEAYKRAKIEPGKPVAGVETLVTLSLIFAAISIGLTIAASFFKPREKRQGTINTTTVDPDNVTRNQKFAPRYAFDSIQDPAVIGTTIPVIYANRISLSEGFTPPRQAGTYGGVRVNLQLLWSQILSVGGDQMLRSIFMLGEANIASIEGIAIGDNPLGSYDLLDDTIMDSCGRLTVYYRPFGGRIQSEDRVWGRNPTSDPGNADEKGAADVYQIISTNDLNQGSRYEPNFCYSYKPTTSTVFGLSSWLPNGVGYRVNPVISATGQIEKQSKDNGDKFRIDWTDDYVALGNLWKYRYSFHRRCCFSGDSKTYQVGEVFYYTLYSSTDAETVFVFNKDNARESDAEAADGRVTCNDVGSAIAAKQSSVDESLVIGDLYKIGGCLAVLISRSPSNDPFVSDADNFPVGGGITITYTFKVVKAGYVDAPGNNLPSWSGTEIKPQEWWYYGGDDLNESIDGDARHPTVSGITQGFKCDIADITITRSSRIFEVGIKSTVGIKVNGICNFRSAKNFKEANDDAGGRLIEKIYPSENTIGIQQYTSGTITMAEDRYSFFRVYCRPNSDSEFQNIGISIGVKSRTSQPVYNFVRFEFMMAALWQLRFEPISSWELKSGSVSTPLIVIDYRVEDESVQYVSAYGGVRVAYCGYEVSNSFNTFKLDAIEPMKQLGLVYTDQDYNVMTDPWGKVAEAFCYDEIQTTVAEGPEHEIVYVNVITENQTIPLYDDLSIIGLNIRATQQWTQLSQVSVYVSAGRTVRRLLEFDSLGPSNLFPDILRDLLLSPRFGMGDCITESQIDVESFAIAANWCKKRRYFFDGVIADKVNLRQWAADTAGGMLLEFLQRDGRFALQPAFVFPEEFTEGIPHGPLPIKGIFTAGNIVEDSFSMEFLPEEDRQPVQASVKWREERMRDNYSSSGLFPVEREVLVREASAPESSPIEAFNISEYCTNLEHAIDFACYLIRVRRLITHTIKFSTTPDGIDMGIRAGDYIKFALDFTHYDEFANGAVLADGTVVTTRPDLMATGTHQATYWDGSDGPVVDGNIVIGSNGLATPTGVVFIKKNVNSQIRVYKIESISLGENGVIDIEAVHHPVDSSGVSMISKNWTTYETDDNWVIKTS